MSITLVEVLQMGIELVARSDKLTKQLQATIAKLHEAEAEVAKFKEHLEKEH